MPNAARPRPGTSVLGNQRGVALVLAFFLLIMVAAGVAIMATGAWQDVQLTEREDAVAKSLYAAEAGIAFAENRVWNDYLQATAGSPGQIDQYQLWLTASGVPVGNSALAVPVPQLDGRTRIANVRLTRRDAATSTFVDIQATGMDRFNNLRTVTSHVLIQGDFDSDINFATMAQSMACLFCHSRFDNALRVYNTNPARYGSFERVRIAALGDIYARQPITPPADAFIDFDTIVAGTLYTRGFLVNKLNGQPMDDVQFTASSFDSYQFDPATNYVDQNGAGAPTTVNLIPATTTAGVPDPGANLYYPSYPTNPADQTDGVLPDTMPAVFPDVDNNLVVSAPDIAARMAKVAAEVGPRGPGTVSGGIKVDVPPGNTWATPSLPAPGDANLGVIDAAAGVHTGNVILVGTAANPLVVDKTVVIDGDVIIQGVVQGEGQIYASGNIYLPGDVVYNDGPQWGMTATGQRNLLMLRAGGNIVINDYLTPQKTFNPADQWGPTLPTADALGVIDDPTAVDVGDHRVNANNWSFAMEQMAMHNRTEWTKTQQNLMKNNGTAGMATGLVANATYDPTYRPKYQVMGPGDPVYIYALQYKVGGNTWGAYWNTTYPNWRGDARPPAYWVNEDVSMGGVGNAQALDATGQLAVGGWNGNGSIDGEWDQNGNGILEPAEDLNGNGVRDPHEDLNNNGVLDDQGVLVMLSAADVATQNGAVVQMAPRNGWISDQNMKSLWINDNATRPGRRPITIEAGLHADNTIFAESRNHTRYNREARGQLTIDGMLMARYLTILAPGDASDGENIGFRMNYDPRLVTFKEGLEIFPVTAHRLAMEYN